MKKIFRNLMLFGVATAMFAACGDEPEVTKKDTSEKQKEQKQNPQGNVTIENGAIKAAFSVGDGKKVYFSQGNLQYQASTNTWRFAENQWDFIGTHSSEFEEENGGTIKGSDNANISETYDGWIDLFGWGTSGWKSGAFAYQPYSTSRDYSDYYPGACSTFDLTGICADADWGVYNKISNGGNKAGMWRTLTNKEWQYLLRDYLYSLGCVDGINGLILLPDDWELPDGISFTPQADEWKSNDYTIKEWAKMEVSGAVFIPASGSRSYTYVENVGLVTSVGNVGLAGCYWSSSHCGDGFAYGLLFGNDVVTAYSGDVRYYGQSVRLVQDVK